MTEPDATLPPRVDVDGATLPPATSEDLATIPPPPSGSSSSSSSAASSGMPAVPGYEILSELGRGGMGVVYQARHLGLNRLVALKMILSGTHAGATELSRFLIEAQAVAKLQHPHIVQLFDSGQHEGRPYFTLEFVEGGSLLRLKGKLAPPEAARLVEQLARGAAYAHSRGIIHRDLKPENVLLAADGTPKITDFGLAKQLDAVDGMTQTGAVMGTPSYMAPEQAGGKGKEIGPAADIWALGAILYWLLTGRPPFQAATQLDTIMQVVGDDPVPPRQRTQGIPRNIEIICLKCLEKSPAKRYSSATELADDLNRFLNDEPIRAKPPGTIERLNRVLTKNPGTTVAYLMGSVALAALLYFFAPLDGHIYQLLRVDHIRFYVQFLPTLLLTAAIVQSSANQFSLRMAVIAIAGLMLISLTGLQWDFDPIWAGLLHGATWGLIGRTVAWAMRRTKPVTLLGAVLGGFGGLILGNLYLAKFRGSIQASGIPTSDLPRLAFQATLLIGYLGAAVAGLLSPRRKVEPRPE